MSKKIKTYVLTLSTAFPVGHSRAGQPTYFKEKVTAKEFPAIIEHGHGHSTIINGRKLHTIRANYPLWEARFREIQRGEAVLSIRQWSGAPYRSKQVEIARLSREDGIGIQRLTLADLINPTYIGVHRVDLPSLAFNDGLNYGDWHEWFKGYDLSQPLAIIHFTKYRY